MQLPIIAQWVVTNFQRFNWLGRERRHLEHVLIVTCDKCAPTRQRIHMFNLVLLDQPESCHGINLMHGLLENLAKQLIFASCFCFFKCVRLRSPWQCAKNARWHVSSYHVFGFMLHIIIIQFISDNRVHI